MAKDVEILGKSEQYKGYFRINRYRLRHRLHAGGWSGELQRELFDCASTIGDLQQTTVLKGRIARYLHNHKNDQQKSG